MQSSPTQSDQADRTGHPKYLTIFVAIAGIVLTLDQVAKWLAVRELRGRGEVPIWDGVLSLRLVGNSGAAFGLGSGMTVIFPLVALVVVVAIVRYARSLASLPWAIGLGLLLGGAGGNLIDRMFREPGFLRGHVVDFLELPNWPVFNFADMAIVSAAALLAFLAATGRRIDNTREPSGKPGQTEKSPSGATGDMQ